MSQTEIKFLYFSPGEGRAVARFGTESHIGATRTPSGFVIDPKSVTAIPEIEVKRFTKDYRDAVRNGDLVQREKADFDQYISDLEAELTAEHEELETTPEEKEEPKDEGPTLKFSDSEDIKHDS